MRRPRTIDPHESLGRYRELQSYLDWSEDDVDRIRNVYGIVKPNFDQLIDDFYAQIQRHPNAHRVITGGREQIERLKQSLLDWLRDLFNGTYDRNYVERRWRVGCVHVEIGLDQVYASAALARLRKGLVRSLIDGWSDDAEELTQSLESLNMLLDMELAIIQTAYEEEFKLRARQSRR